MLTRYALADTPEVTPFTLWRDAVIAALQDLYGDAWRAHGMATTIPANVPQSMQQYVGQAAAQFDNATYVALANAGRIDMSRPQVASNNGQVVYVLAPPAVVATMPHTMTAVERATNAIFTAADNAADTVGLPSLDGIENFLKGMGREVLIGVGVTLAVALVLNTRKR